MEISEARGFHHVFAWSTFELAGVYQDTGRLVKSNGVRTAAGPYRIQAAHWKDGLRSPRLQVECWEYTMKANASDIALIRALGGTCRVQAICPGGPPKQWAEEALRFYGNPRRRTETKERLIRLSINRRWPEAGRTDELEATAPDANRVRPSTIAQRLSFAGITIVMHPAPTALDHAGRLGVPFSNANGCGRDCHPLPHRAAR